MTRSMSPMSRLHQDEVQFRMILGVTYPFFLVAAIAERVVPTHDSDRPAPRRSVFGEARTMAVQAISYAFMG